MKAAGIPLVGADPVTTAMLIAAWTVMPSVSPHPEQHAEARPRIHADPEPVPGEKGVERQDAEHADEAELFADDRKNEVRVLLGQVLLFQAALHEADAGPAAGTEGEQRIPELVSAAFAHLLRPQEGRDPPEPVRIEEDDVKPGQHDERSRDGQIVPAQPGHDRDGDGDGQHERRRPEVAADQDAADDRPRDADQRQGRRGGRGSC